jgi:hypothetical protein
MPDVLVVAVVSIQLVQIVLDVLVADVPAHEFQMMVEVSLVTLPVMPL